MSASDKNPADDALGVQPSAQDSALHLADDAPTSATRHESSAQIINPPTDNGDEQEETNDPLDDAEDSGFDSGSLIGDDTDTLASSIMHYRMENGRQYHAYRDGAYWVRPLQLCNLQPQSCSNVSFRHAGSKR